MNDSIWAVVAGTVKAYNLPIDYVLYELSYVNMIMYGAVRPQDKPPSRNGKQYGKREEVIKADDPANRDRVREILQAID